MLREAVKLPDQRCVALMTPEEWCAWVKWYAKEHFHWSNEYIAEACDLSIATVNRIISGNPADLRSSTRHIITKFIIDRLGEEYPCTSLTPDKATSRMLEQKDEEIKHLSELNAFYRDKAVHSDAEEEKKITYLKNQVSDLKRDNRRLLIASSIIVGLVVIVLLVDVLVGSVGWVRY